MMGIINKITLSILVITFFNSCAKKSIPQGNSGFRPITTIPTPDFTTGGTGTGTTTGGTDGADGNGTTSGGTSGNTGGTTGGTTGGPGGNGTATKAGEGIGCTSVPTDICKGGYGADADAKSLYVNVYYGNPPGSRLTNDPTGHATAILEKLNNYYKLEGHQHLHLKLLEAKEVPQESDSVMVSKYVTPNIATVLFVNQIPGATAGYVAYPMADLTKKHAYSVMEFPLVAAGVFEHEFGHLFALSHTVSANGGSPRFFLPGYNQYSAVLQNKNI
jgi:hypothetical protein